MRLVIVTNDFPPRPGGIQQYLGNLVDAWPHPVRVLASAVEVSSNDERVVRGPHRFMWPTPGVRRWVEREVAAFKADAILFGAPYPLPSMGRKLRQKLGIPVAVLGHGAEVMVPAAIPLVRSMFVRPLRGADARFAVSRFTQGGLERLTGRPVTYVGGGVDVDIFAPADQAPAEIPTIGCVSRFVPRKRHQLVLEAASRLGSQGRQVRVLIVGRGRKEAALRRKAKALGVDARFEIDVPWRRLPDLYREMDVFCMPCRSRWFGLEIEGLGLVYLEASATGIPVLAGDSGGSPETVEEGVTGFVVTSLDDIVDRLDHLLSDPDRMQSMGRAGRRRVEAEFTWDCVARRLEEGLRAIVDSAP